MHIQGELVAVCTASTPPKALRRQIMLSTHVFIISWAGQHENAVSIAKTLRNAASQISIVYSDPNPGLTLDVDCELINRPDELFWGDKFKACLDACHADLMLVIHGDCECDDWGSLLQKCRLTMDASPVIGVWAPLVDWTALDIRRTRIVEIKPGTLSVVAQTDAIVFCLSTPVMQRMKLAKYAGNTYGWGIDAMAVAFCYANKLLAVVDESIAVKHPKARGYEGDVARGQAKAFLSQLSLLETVQNRLLWAHVKNNDIANRALAKKE